MKRLFSALLAILFSLSLFTGCGAAAPETETSPHQLHVVTTIFPAFDWARQVLGEQADQADLTFLLEGGVDLHSFQPSAADIVKLSSCDLFVYVGGESDAWVEDALKESVNPDMKVLNLMELLGENAREEERTEGMSGEAEEETAYDEHVWLSLKNAQRCTNAIAQALSALDQDHAEDYAANAETYCAQLSQLDEAYQEAVDGGSRDTLLFGDRFPFLYLTKDYGLTYYAAFSGCSAETEASFETIAFLSGKVDELNLPAVLTMEGPEHRVAETIVENTTRHDQKILTMDSMQATTGEDVAAGVTYLSIMEQNLQILTEALY